MANIQIQDVDQRVQYSATGGQTIFTVPFPFLANSDLVVYQNSTLINLGTSAGEYGVSGAGNPGGGTVTLVTGATLDDIITIYGNQPIDRTSIYSATISNLTGSDLNNDFNREIIMLKQLWTTQNLLQLQYQPYAEVSQDEAVTIDRWIPILAAGQLWRKNAGDTAIEAVDGPATGGIAGTLYTYLTLTDQTSELPNSTDLSALAAGFMVNDPGTSITTRAMTGTANQINVANGDGISGAPTFSIASNPILPGTEGLGLPEGTTAQRPGSPSGTNLRFNTSITALEYWNGSAWSILEDDTVQYLPLIGGTMSGDIDMGGNRVTNAADPVSNSDYVTLQYMNALIYNTHPACICATDADLPTWTYDNGSSGVGATLTAPSNGSSTFDGVTPSDGDRVLLINQTSNLPWQGIYTIVQGDGSNPTVLTRATDFDQASEINAGDRTTVIQGTTYALSVWTMTQTSAITVGTTDITFAQNPAGSGALLIANNLSDVADVATSRTNLGLGTMAIQDAASVAITGGTMANVAFTGGTIDSSIIGGTTPAAGTFTTLIGTTTTGGNILLTGDAIQHVSDTDNQILFGTDTQSFETGGSSRIDISDSGVRLGGANSRVTTILDEDDMASNSNTALVTQQSLVSYISNKSAIAGMIDFTIANDTDADHDISITAGQATDSTKSHVMTLSSGITKQIDANWAAGTNQGGFPSALTLSNDTWYHFFIIKNPTTGVVDAGWDTSTSATNLLADATGYTLYRRVGSVLTDGSANILPFRQLNSRFYWLTPIADVSGSITTTQAAYTLSVPPGFNSIAICNILTSLAGNNPSVYLHHSAQVDQAPSLTIGVSPGTTWRHVSSGSTMGGLVEIPMDTSAQFYGRSDTAASNFSVITLGYIDFRGANSQ